VTAAFSPRPGAYDLHFRQHYALSTSDDPGNANWKQRSFCGFVPSPKGLHGWKHRVCSESSPFARVWGAGRAPAVGIWKHRFARSSNWKHTFAILRPARRLASRRKVTLQSALPKRRREDPGHFRSILQSYGSNFANLWVK